MTKTEFLLTISKQYHEDKWWELRKISIIGLLIDPVPNSPNKHDDNCLADSKENYWWDLGSQRAKELS